MVKKNKAIFITRDLDFANILNFPPRKYYGIIVLKLPHFYSAESIKRVLKEFISKIDKNLLIKSTVIVEEGRFRIRK